MTKEKAIKLIDDRMCYGRGKWSEHHMPEIDDYWKAGQIAIKALEEPQWIPCSERLPEEYGEYRITWATSAWKKRFIGDSEYEITGEWDSENDRFKGEWLLDEYIENYPDVKVLAWKPLEEPWGGDAE